jgi:hypothetical protein
MATAAMESRKNVSGIADASVANLTKIALEPNDTEAIRRELMLRGEINSRSLA